MEVLFLSLVVVSALLLLLAVAFFIAAYSPRRAPTKDEDLESGLAKVADVGTTEVPAGVKRFKWAEIETLTENFSTPAIGEGGFSTVYLGKLPDDSSSLVAVKVHRESERLHVAFKQELEVLLKLRHHHHVVRLLGYCDDHRDDGALVFEYVPNGTLHDRLHGSGGEGGVLTWSERMAIAHDLATAVAYLHESCDLQIIHSDLKPANVLLDSDRRAKLCDFGSAKLGFSSTVVRGRRAIVGSPGYSDPHYLRTGMTSKKSDVYSFGVVLLELVTGKEAFCEKAGMLTKEMAEVLREAGTRVGEMVDGRLGGGFAAAEAVAVAEVVTRCVGEQPSLRPSMAEIVRVLEEKVGRSIMAVDKKQQK